MLKGGCRVKSTIINLITFLIKEIVYGLFFIRDGFFRNRIDKVLTNNYNET